MHVCLCTDFHAIAQKLPCADLLEWMPPSEMMETLHYWRVLNDHQSTVVHLPVTVTGSVVSWTAPNHSNCCQPFPLTQLTCANKNMSIHMSIMLHMYLLCIYTYKEGRGIKFDLL